VRGAASNGRPYRETSDEASRTSQTTSKPEPSPRSGKGMEETYVLSMWCPVYRGVTLIWAFVRNLRTWTAMPREKVQAVTP
jgi:hypothetical protein